jgi:hypothetical protein
MPVLSRMLVTTAAERPVGDYSYELIGDDMRAGDGGDVS